MKGAAWWYPWQHAVYRSGEEVEEANTTLTKKLFGTIDQQTKSKRMQVWVDSEASKNEFLEVPEKLKDSFQAAVCGAIPNSPSKRNKEESYVGETSDMHREISLLGKVD